MLFACPSFSRKIPFCRHQPSFWQWCFLQSKHNLYDTISFFEQELLKWKHHFSGSWVVNWGSIWINRDLYKASLPVYKVDRRSWKPTKWKGMFIDCPWFPIFIYFYICLSIFIFFYIFIYFSIILVYRYIIYIYIYFFISIYIYLYPFISYDLCICVSYTCVPVQYAIALSYSSLVCPANF